MNLRAATAAGLVTLALLGACAHTTPRATDRLDPATQPKFVNALPNPLTAAARPTRRATRAWMTTASACNRSSRNWN